VRTIERRQGIKIACPEEIGLDLGWLTPAAAYRRVAKLGNNEYTTYLRQRIREFEDR
jgi:glucose-1-phosphate thymidylyltransferase